MDDHLTAEGTADGRAPNRSGTVASPVAGPAATVHAHQHDDPSAPGASRVHDEDRRASPAARILLGVLTASGAFPGVWAVAFPRSFYDSFPGARAGWIAVDGPFNEHLLRDVGALFLALGVVAGWGALSGRRTAVRGAAAGWLTFTVLHAAYHVHHLDLYAPTDRWLNLATLAGSVVAAAAVLVLPTRPHRRAVPARVASS
jgi:hypothetical protein